MSNLEGLTIRQRAIVRRLVELQDDGNDGPLLFLTSSSGTRIIVDCADPIDASRGDLKSLDAAGLVAFEEQAAGRGRVSLLPAGRLAVESNFGMAKDRLILKTLYQIHRSGGSEMVTAEQLADETGLSVEEVNVYAQPLAEAGQIIATFGGFEIDDAGIIEAQRPPVLPASPSIHQTFHGPVQAGSLGHMVGSNVTFGNFSAGEPTIDSLREAVVTEQARMASILESILDTLDERTTTRGTKNLAEKGKALAEAAKSLYELGQAVWKGFGG